MAAKTRLRGRASQAIATARAHHALDQEFLRELRMVELIVAYVRGDDAAAESILNAFALDPSSDADRTDRSPRAIELLLAGELRRRQGRFAEAEALLKRAEQLRAAVGASDVPIDQVFVTDAYLAHALALRHDPAHEKDATRRLGQLVDSEADYPRPLPWLEAEAHRAVGR